MNSSAANSLLKFLEEPLEIFSGVRNRCSRKNSPYYSISLSSSAFSRTFERSTDPSIARRADSIGKAKLLAFLTNSLGKAVEISQDEWFNDAKDLIYQWFVYLQKQDTQAFIYVQKIGKII